MEITLQCECGNRFNVPNYMKRKITTCPACGKPTRVHEITGDREGNEHRNPTVLGRCIGMISFLFLPLQRRISSVSIRWAILASIFVVVSLNNLILSGVSIYTATKLSTVARKDRAKSSVMDTAIQKRLQFFVDTARDWEVATQKQRLMSRIHYVLASILFFIAIIQLDVAWALLHGQQYRLCVVVSVLLLLVEVQFGGFLGIATLVCLLRDDAFPHFANRSKQPLETRSST